MRAALHAALVAAGYRVFQPDSTVAATDKPYLVVKRNGDTSGPAGRFEFIDVWVYSAKGSYILLDQHIDAIIALLSDRVLTRADGSAFSLEYYSTIGDGYFDEALNALTKSVRFRVPIGNR